MKKLLGAASAAILASLGAAHAVAVDVELQLLVDVSGSVDTGEFNLQRQGYIDAFNDTDVINAILDGAEGSIAVQLIYWSASSQQQVAVDWTLINDATSAQAFAAAVAAASRPYAGGTAIGSAISFGNPLFDDNGYEGTRLVQDVSGDGENNDGILPGTARSEATADGITINGIAIGNQALVDYYENNVVTADGFVIQASTFGAFSNGIERKLIAEIRDDNPAVPLPAPALLMGTALAGFFGAKKRKSAK